MDGGLERFGKETGLMLVFWEGAAWCDGVWEGAARVMVFLEGAAHAIAFWEGAARVRGVYLGMAPR